MKKKIYFPSFEKFKISITVLVFLLARSVLAAQPSACETGEESDLTDPLTYSCVSRTFTDYDGHSITATVRLPENLTNSSAIGYRRLPCPTSDPYNDQSDELAEILKFFRDYSETKKLKLDGNCTYYFYSPSEADKLGIIDLSGINDLTIEGEISGNTPTTKIIFVAPTTRTSNDFLSINSSSSDEFILAMVPQFKHGFYVGYGTRILFRNLAVDFIAPVRTGTTINWNLTIPLHTFGTIESAGGGAKKFKLDPNYNQYINPYMRKIVSIEDDVSTGDTHHILWSKYNENRPFDINLVDPTPGVDQYQGRFSWSTSGGNIYLESPELNAISDGHRMRISHATGAHAFNFQSRDGLGFAEDISLIDVTIYSSYGVGVGIAMERGLYINKLRIVEPGSGASNLRRATSVGAGGIVGTLRSDAIIINSVIRHNIDDAINLYPPSKLPLRIERVTNRNGQNYVEVKIFGNKDAPKKGDPYYIYNRNWTLKAIGIVKYVEPRSDNELTIVGLTDNSIQTLANSLLGASQFIECATPGCPLVPYVAVSQNQNGKSTFIKDNLFENGNAGVVLKVSNAYFGYNDFIKMAEGLSIYAKAGDANVTGGNINNIVVEQNEFRNVGASGEMGVIATASFMPNFSTPEQTNHFSGKRLVQSGPLCAGDFSQWGSVPSRGYAYGTALVNKIKIVNNTIYSAIVPPIWINNAKDVAINGNTAQAITTSFPTASSNGIFLTKFNDLDYNTTKLKFWKNRRWEIREGMCRQGAGMPDESTINANHLTIMGSCNFTIGTNQSYLSHSDYRFEKLNECQ